MLVNKKLLQEHKRENHAYNYTVELLYYTLVALVVVLLRNSCSTCPIKVGPTTFKKLR